MVRLQLLGTIDLRDETDREVGPVLAQPKRLALVAYLAAAEPFGPHRRDTLLGLFWPELDQDHARNALSQAVHFLRRWLGEGALCSRGGDELELDEAVVWTDVRAFHRALDEGRVEEAVGLYRGDLLPSFFVPDSAGFEEWLERVRARLRARAAEAARLLAERHEAGGELTLAIRRARQAVELSNGDERPLRRLIELLARLGDRSAAIHAFDSFARRLSAEFDAEPAGETVALIERIRAARPGVPSPVPAPLATELSDRYVIERELGGGGMARVFLASETALGRRVALKVLPPELVRSVSADQFRQEIQVAARLHHPHIVPLLAAGQAGDLLYYTMPFVEGESLRDRIERDGRLPVTEAVRLLTEIARALQCAHQRGIVHRDLKPGNILLAAGQAQVCDFGIAKALSDAAQPGGLATGTPRYMAPEQAGGADGVDQRADLYSLGVVAYEILTGAPPFRGDTAEVLLQAHATETPPSVAMHRADLPAPLAQLVMRLLEKRPADRPGSADAVLGALETVLTPPAGTPVRPGTRTRRLRLAVAAAAVGILGAVLATRGFRSAPAPRLDPNLVAIAPFEVLEPTLAVWREGLVDILSRNLDGAGPLRTVSPTVAVRRWHGRGDARAGQSLGRETGAGLVVTGELMPSGEDSIRLRATLLDAQANRRLGEVELRGSSSRLDQVVETLTLELLREIGRDRPVGAVRQASISARPLPALKAFLRGEQFYRLAMWDSALAQYDHAIALDSEFALPHHRMQQVVGWGTRGTNRYRDGEWYKQRAAQLNHGQTVKDSLLIVEGGFGGRLDPADPDYFTRYRQHLVVLEQAKRLYPGDPEVWYELGEALFHAHYNDIASLAEPLEAFDRTLELDPAFGPAYIHTVRLALALGMPDRARKYAAAYLASTTAVSNGSSLALEAVLLDPTRAGSAGTARLLDTTSEIQLWNGAWDLAQWPDSAETAVRLARAAAERSSRNLPGRFPIISDSLSRRTFLALLLAFRGHLEEAYRTAPSMVFRQPTVENQPFFDLALLGVVPRDSVAKVFGRMLREDSLWPPYDRQRRALPWWGAVRDTASLARFAERADSAARRQPHPVARAHLYLFADVARAYTTLATGDSAGALRAFSALPDSLCMALVSDCFYEKLTQARLAAALRKDRTAAEVFDRWIFGRQFSAVGVLATLERGQVAERLGQRDRALASYRFVADVWRRADNRLQPAVAEARRALERLEGGRP
jgi:DNA-binding SARP family transcriptional activator